jgi:hypothetical protein
LGGKQSRAAVLPATTRSHRHAGAGQRAKRRAGLGVAVDVYHALWDPDLASEIARASAAGLAFHVCDRLVPTRDLLNDRGMMFGLLHLVRDREFA